MYLLVASSARCEHGHIYPSLGFTTDYRYNGVSLSDREAVWQANLHWQSSDGLFAGIFGTGVDFNDPSDTSYELDLYAGHTITRGRMRYTVGALYASFPEKDFAGPTYDFAQLKWETRRVSEKWTWGASANWTPQASYGTGTAWRIVAEAERQLTPWLVCSANIGRRWIEHGTDRTYWDVGLRSTFRRIVMEIRYVGTNVTGARCGPNVRACDPAIVATLTWRLPSLEL